MERFIESSLVEWSKKNSRKPLIIRGARQVGKSWIVRHFGNKYFKNHFYEINLEKRPDLHAIFKENLDTKRILQQLEIIFNASISPKKDLIFIDEIQECPEAIMALRYFYEDQPDLHIISAGSLLEFTFFENPFPVGRLEQIDMYPMTFYEFLLARGKDKLVTLLQQIPKPLAEIIDNQIKAELKNYLLVGGMPECVKLFVQTESIPIVQKVQDDLLFTYKQDFKKYRPNVDSACLDDVLNGSVQKIGQQIIYSKLSDRFTMPTIRKAFETLKNARILFKVENVSVAGLPLSTSGKQFKCIFLDVGLMVRYSGISISKEFMGENILGIFRGSVAEQFVGQEVLAASTRQLNYWARTEKSSTAEVDYIVVTNGEIIPIEVKSGAKGTLRSLHLLLENNLHIKRAIIFSDAPFGKIEKLHFIPIYYAGYGFDKIE